LARSEDERNGDVTPTILTEAVQCGLQVLNRKRKSLHRRAVLAAYIFLQAEETICRRGPGTSV